MTPVYSTDSRSQPSNVLNDLSSSGGAFGNSPCGICPGYGLAFYAFLALIGVLVLFQWCSRNCWWFPGVWTWARHKCCCTFVGVDLPGKYTSCHRSTNIRERLVRLWEPSLLRGGYTS